MHKHINEEYDKLPRNNDGHIVTETPTLFQKLQFLLDVSTLQIWKNFQTELKTTDKMGSGQASAINNAYSKLTEAGTRRIALSINEIELAINLKTVPFIFDNLRNQQ